MTGDAATGAMSEVANTPPRLCSAKACRACATHAVIWRNPKLHVPGRRKVWLACGEHHQLLADYVGRRGFLIEVIGITDLTDRDG